jgi:hypothetical protein
MQNNSAKFGKDNRYLSLKTLTAGTGENQIKLFDCLNQQKRLDSAYNKLNKFQLISSHKNNIVTALRKNSKLLNFIAKLKTNIEKAQLNRNIKNHVLIVKKIRTQKLD